MPQNPLEPREISEEAAAALGIQPGWWAVDEIGTPVLGPYPTREAVLIAIANKGREVR